MNIHSTLYVSHGWTGPTPQKQLHNPRLGESSPFATKIIA